MAVLNVQDEFQSGDNVTATNLNNLVNQANFVDGAGETTDGSTLEVHTSGYLKVKNNGIGDEHLQQMTDTEATTAGNENGRAVTTNHIRNDAVTNAKIAANAVTYEKMQNVSATNRVLGRDSAGAGEVEEISPEALRTMINVENGATADQTGDEIKTAIGNATQSADGLMSSTDKTKLDGIEVGAEENVQSDWNATSGDALILNKPTIPTGTVTEVDAGTGLATSPATGIIGTGTIGIANGGVDTDQLADGAVTSAKTDFSTLEIGHATAAFIDLKTPGTDDYDARVISQGDSVTLDQNHLSRVRVESSSQLGFVAGADPATSTPGPEVMTIKQTEVVVNEGGVDIDFRVEGNTGTALITTDANSNKVILGSSGVRLNFANLPTSSSGLVSGDVWNNSGVLNIVP